MSGEGLTVRDLRVTFDGGVTAVDGVDLDIHPGDLRFLIGPNGAGKTTLVDAVTGLVRASGSIRFGGEEISGEPVHRIARRGIGRTFQTATVFEQLTVEQNLDIAAGAGRSALTLLRRRRHLPDSVGKALEITGLAGLRHRP
ncbi:ATP-binding cassette domain-containing protein, partial [Streptomyces sp. SID8455]|nr:ATP-binding cassette domain-containing protein [Streptomyces sp. SID8455]